MAAAYTGVMLFLLNDVVFNFEANDLAPPLTAGQFGQLRLDTVASLGAEMFAADPMLHQTQPDKAARLAALIALRAPQINAALFVAPAKGCRVSDISCRYAQLGFEVMSGLWSRQQAGGLTTVLADREVWRRLAA